ncbi:MAG: geranylgeranylglycerol-phosphate geranylgeranyltransferase [Calditrichia bacterium]
MSASLKGAFLLIRPVNLIIAVLSIFIAILVTGSLQPLSHTLLACFSGGLILAAANCINDYFDLEIDRINKPGRVLPSGMISEKTALALSGLLFTVGIAMAAFINLPVFLLAFLFSLLLFLYSYKLKRLSLWGNLLVSLASAMAFIYGGLAVGRVRATIYPALFAFFFHFGREMIKDMQDIRGDSAQLAATFPIKYGIPATLRIVTATFLFLMALTLWPFFSGYYNTVYLAVILLGVFPVLLFSMLSIRFNQTIKWLGFISNLLKADMLVGLLAIYLG